MSKDFSVELFKGLYQDVFEYLLIIEKELQRFVSEDWELARISRYVLTAGGKRIRPLLVLLSCEAVGGNKKDALSLSTAIELAHTMGLIQDDIFDDAENRRGRKAVHVVWGIPNAVLASDYLFLKSVQAVTSLADKLDKREKQIITILNLMVKAGLDAAQGEYLDLMVSQKKEATIEECLEIARKKTGAFIKASLEIGAVIGNASEHELEALSEYGDSLGIAYQLADDILGLTSMSETLGKEIGADIRNGKVTAVIAHCLNMCSNDQRKIVLEILGKKNAEKKEMQMFIDVLKNCGSIQYTYNLAKNYASAAKEKLRILPQTKAKEILEKLADIVVSREW